MVNNLYCLSCINTASQTDNKGRKRTNNKSRSKPISRCLHLGKTDHNNGNRKAASGTQYRSMCFRIN